MNIFLSEAELRPLIQQVVTAALEQLDVQRQQFGTKLAYSEPEAAALLSIKPHVLRDARLRGELAGSRVGKSIRYERDEILRYLHKMRGL